MAEVRPWPNDSIFHSTFLSTFQLLIFPQRMSAKNIYAANICPLNETLLRMLSLDLLDKVAKRLNFHSTTILLLDFFDKDQTSLNITRLHSTYSTRWPKNGSIFSSSFCRVKNRVKNRVVWPGPKVTLFKTSENAVLQQGRLRWGDRRGKNCPSYSTLSIYPICGRGIFRHCRQFGSRKFFWGEAPRPPNCHCISRKSMY